MSSPKKKLKTDIESRWQAAVDAMNEDKNENADADEEVFNTPTKPVESPRGKTKSKAKGKAGMKGRKGKAHSSEGEDTDMLTDLSSDGHALKALFIPPPIDESINIGEEKVFAKEKKSASMYWPAYVKYYKESTKAGEVALYGVRYLDETEKEIPRGWFFTSDQDEFATCKVRIFFFLCFMNYGTRDANSRRGLA
jgi:hypothetical protein